ncbi:MAG TPA: hypothetical protein VKD91_04425 [Pyrinomonadaceae bacterium]|nr:hypothetical protein [Pyrinomonadaceae bacterium]
MNTKFMIAAMPLVAALTVTACHGKATTTAQSGAAQTSSMGGDLRFKAPDGWVTEKASSTMRVAQYKLPKSEGDKDDGSLVLYYFGSNQGGSPQANIDRWISQMQQPDGSSSKDKAKTETLTVNGLKVTTVDVTGTYTAEMAPGSGTFHNDDNYRLRAAVIETPKGNYYVKLAGPAKTIAKWDQEYNNYLKSFEFK